MKKIAGNRGAELAVLTNILADTAGVQLRTEQSKSGTVEEDGFQAFGISLIDVDFGAVAGADIDITGITAVLEKSTGGAAFSNAGITQPTFVKAAGLVSVDYRFLAAEWVNGDVYKLEVAGIEAEVNADTVFIKTMIWSNMVLESANVEAKIDIIDGFHDVPAIDSVDNDQIRDVIGNKGDGHNANSVYAKLHSADDHLHSEGDVYPTLANDVQVTGAAGAWTLGAFTEIVPINTITDDFDIHFIEVSTTSDNDVYEMHFFAVEVLIAKIRFARTTNQVRISAKPTQTVIIPANTQIQAKLATQAGGSKTADISIQFHPY